MYKLQRLPGRGWYKEVTEDHLCKEILDSIKECLWLKQLSTQPEGEWRQSLADVPWPDPHTEFAAANCHTYKKFTAARQDSYEGIMALARDTNQWAMAAGALLGEKMEWMSHSISLQCFSSHCCSSSCWHSGGQWCRRSRSLGPKVTGEDPQVTSLHRGTVRGQSQSSSPSQQKQWVNFTEGRALLSSKDSLENDTRIDEVHQLPPPTWWIERAPNDGANWSRPKAGKEEDLECPSPLEPHLQELLGGEE